MQVIVLRTDEALGHIASEWSRLEPPTPFGSWAFVRLWLEQHSKSVEPFVIAVRSSEGTLVAIAPWCIQRMAGGLRRLTGIGSHDSWQHDALYLQPELAPLVAPLIAECLWRHRRSWDWLSLVLRTDESRPLADELAAKGWLIEDRADRHQHHVIDFGGSFEAYWQARSSSHRKKMRALATRLNKVPHRYILADAETLDELLDALFAMHGERWRGVRDWPPYYALIRELCQRALSRGELCLGALEIDGRLAALDLALCCGERGFGLMRVYHPDCAEYSPGALLGAWMLERLCAMGCRVLDCGPGHYEWKDRYSTGQHAGMRALCAARTNPAGLLVLCWLGLVQPWRRKTVSSAELKGRFDALRPGQRPPRTAARWLSP